MPVNPHCLFAYWNVNNTENVNLNNNCGNQYIALKVHNITLNKSFLIRVNNFSDNWYITVDDPNCSYNVEIGIKTADGKFISLCKSNTVFAPQNNISDDTTQEYAHYKNVKQKIKKPKATSLPKNTYSYIFGSTSPKKDSSINMQETIAKKLSGMNSEGILHGSGSRRRI